uniref:Uncharacterized protein n=1 Tax=Anguilla anguilla TaxID=7936 RepID=A0A0E9PR87_ANGAN
MVGPVVPYPHASFTRNACTNTHTHNHFLSAFAGWDCETSSRPQVAPLSFRSLSLTYERDVPKASRTGWIIRIVYHK